jgi:hypothetical protein
LLRCKTVTPEYAKRQRKSNPPASESGSDNISEAGYLDSGQIAAPE